MWREVSGCRAGHR